MDIFVAHCYWGMTVWGPDLCLWPSLSSLQLSCSSVMQYRTTVAKMLRRQADESRNAAQFIVTTFHPQVWHVCMCQVHVVRSAHAGIRTTLKVQQSDSRLDQIRTSPYILRSLNPASFSPTLPMRVHHHRLWARRTSCMVWPTPIASVGSTPSRGRMRSPFCRWA